MKLVKNIYFDLNNVGENYEKYEKLLPNILNKVFEKSARYFDISTTTIDTEKLLSVYSELSEANPLHHYPSFWKHIFERLLNRNLNFKEITEVYRIYLDEYEKNIEVYPDFLDLVSACKEKKLKLGIIANGNSERIYRFLEKFRLVNSFNTIVTSGMNPFSKPSSKIFRLALLSLDAIPTESVFVGDRIDTDVIGANSAGIWSIRLLRGSAADTLPRTMVETPDFNIKNLKEVLSLPPFDFERTSGSVVIPCGGRGTRMGPITSKRQKCMISLNGKPVLARLVHLFKDSGFSDIHLILGHCAEEVIDYFGDGSQLGIKTHFYKTNKKSTGASVLEILDELPERFLYSHGNILFEKDMLFELLKKSYKNNCETTFAVTKNKIASTHPVFVYQNGTLSRIIRHPQDEPNEEYYYSVGLAVIQKKDIQNISEKIIDDDSTTEQLFGNAISKTMTINYKKKWFHLETEADVEKYEEDEREKHRYA